MSLLDILWWFGTRIRDDRRVRNTSGGNDSNASASESEREQPAFDLEFIDRDGSQETSGIELIAERANDQSALTDPRQEINVYPTVFADGIVFSNGDEGGWISADGDSYIDQEDL